MYQGAYEYDRCSIWCCCRKSRLCGEIQNDVTWAVSQAPAAGLNAFANYATSASISEMILRWVCRTFRVILTASTAFYGSRKLQKKWKFCGNFWSETLVNNTFCARSLGPILSGCKKSVFINQKSKSKTDKRKNLVFQSYRCLLYTSDAADE